jgi:hypothetical protein
VTRGGCDAGWNGRGGSPVPRCGPGDVRGALPGSGQSSQTPEVTGVASATTYLPAPRRQEADRRKPTFVVIFRRYPPAREAIGDLCFCQGPLIRTDMAMYTIYDEVCCKAGAGYLSCYMNGLAAAAVSFSCPAPESSVRGNFHLQRKFPESVLDFSILYRHGCSAVSTAHWCRTICYCFLPAI